MTIMTEVITTNTQETQKFAEIFANSLSGGEVLCLYGDLGYGKTTFIQGLAMGLGITGKVISPTFIIMRSYRIKKTDKKLKMFYHVDLYRVNSEHEIIDLGLSDIINKPENIVAIEWPAKMGELLPEKRTDILFKYLNENKRGLTVTKKS